MELSSLLVGLLPDSGILAGLLSVNPLLQAAQITLGVLAAGHVFFVFLVTRDILKRSSSLFVQLSAIFFVAALPVVGIFLYALFRPLTTLREKNIEAKLIEIHTLLTERKEQTDAIKEKIQESVFRSKNLTSSKDPNHRVASKTPVAVSSSS